LFWVLRDLYTAWHPPRNPPKCQKLLRPPLLPPSQEAKSFSLEDISDTFVAWSPSAGLFSGLRVSSHPGYHLPNFPSPKPSLPPFYPYTPCASPMKTRLAPFLRLHLAFNFCTRYGGPFSPHSTSEGEPLSSTA